MSTDMRPAGVESEWQCPPALAGLPPHDLHGLRDTVFRFFRLNLEPEEVDYHWARLLRHHQRSFQSGDLRTSAFDYFLNEAGETTVIEPGREYKLLAKNLVEGQTLASFGVAGHAIYLRTDTHLYRIENK